MAYDKESRLSVLVAARQPEAFCALERECAEDWRFMFVRDGKRLIEEARRSCPDALIIDGILPEMDGLGTVDALDKLLGARMPVVIGGAELPLMRSGFVSRGAVAVVAVPWQREELHMALCAAKERLEGKADWPLLKESEGRVGEALRKLGMPEKLAGFTYLCAASALTAQRRKRIEHIGSEIYAPVAKRFDTSDENVERLIRHAVERVMDNAKPEQLYAFFGNTVDPMRGKPTNAQMIAILAERLRDI